MDKDRSTNDCISEFLLKEHKLNIRRILLTLLLVMVMISSYIIPFITIHMAAITASQELIPIVSTREEFIQSFREAMEARETDYTVNIIPENGDTTITKEILHKKKSVLKEAYSANDYLRWSWIDIDTVSQVRNDANVTITFAINYVATFEEEQMVDTKVASILTEILVGLTTDRQKIRAIHDYIIHNVEYDYSSDNRSAYNALFDGVTVCQGYALLMYKMLSEAGITNRIVDGYYGEVSPDKYHVWNLVYLDGNWYHIDTTYDDDSLHYYMLTDVELKAKGFIWDDDKFPSATVKYVEFPMIIISKSEEKPINKDILVIATAD